MGSEVKPHRLEQRLCKLSAPHCLGWLPLVRELLGRLSATFGPRLFASGQAAGPVGELW